MKVPPELKKARRAAKQTVGRNAMIIAKYKEGVPIAKIAKEHHLTQSGVFYVLQCWRRDFETGEGAAERPVEPQAGTPLPDANDQT